MEKDNSKIITVAFVLAGALTAQVLDVLMETLAAAWGAFARVHAQDFVQHVLPVLVGFLTFFILQLNKKTREWADEVVVEIRKVVWPTQKDTMAMTTVTCVMLIVSGLILGLFDSLSGGLIGLITSPGGLFN